MLSPNLGLAVRNTQCHAVVDSIRQRTMQDYKLPADIIFRLMSVLHVYVKTNLFTYC